MRNSIASSRAFSLIELALSLGVAAFCLITVFGLLPYAAQTNRDSTSQTAATSLLSSIISDIRSTPPTTPIRGLAATSVEYQISIPTNPVSSATTNSPLYFSQEGTAQTSLQSQSRYRVTLTFLPNATGTSPYRTATRCYIKLSWPAAAAPDTASGFVEAFASFDRN